MSNLVYSIKNAFRKRPQNILDNETNRASKASAKSPAALGAAAEVPLCVYERTCLSLDP